MCTANAGPTGDAIRQARWRWSLTTRPVSGTIVGIAVEIAPLSCSNLAFCLRRSISAPARERSGSRQGRCAGGPGAMDGPVASHRPRLALPFHDRLNASNEPRQSASVECASISEDLGHRERERPGAGSDAGPQRRLCGRQVRVPTREPRSRRQRSLVFRGRWVGGRDRHEGRASPGWPGELEYLHDRRRRLSRMGHLPVLSTSSSRATTAWSCGGRRCPERGSQVRATRSPTAC